jgi:hypothetical protein
MWESDQPEQEQEESQENREDEDEDDDFGDDFDEFAEGGEGDEDFGDFDEADEPTAAPSQPPPSQFPTTPDILKGLVSRIPSPTCNIKPPFILVDQAMPCRIFTDDSLALATPQPLALHHTRRNPRSNSTLHQCHPP